MWGKWHTENVHYSITEIFHLFLHTEPMKTNPILTASRYSQNLQWSTEITHWWLQEKKISFVFLMQNIVGCWALMIIKKKNNPEKQVPSWMSSDGQSKTKYRLGLSFAFSHARQRSRFLSIPLNMYDFFHAITILISFVSSPQKSLVCRIVQETGEYTFPPGSGNVITDCNQLRTIVSSSQRWLKTWTVLCFYKIMAMWLTHG